MQVSTSHGLPQRELWSAAPFDAIALIKSAILGAIGFFSSNVPFAEMPGGVADALQALRQRYGVQAHTFAPVLGMGHPAHKFMTPTHENRPTRRTPGADVILGKQQALAFQGVEIGSLHDWIAEAGDVAIANIIRHNNDDVWLGIQMDGLVFCEAC